MTNAKLQRPSYAAAAVKAPRNIALWGYGRYGKRLLDALERYWGNYYAVTAIFDSAIGPGDSKALGSISLLPPSELERLYREGAFEAVVISIADDLAREQINRQLEAWGIPTTTLISQDDLRPFEEFHNTSSREAPYGYAEHVYQGVYGNYAQLYFWQTPFFLFDDEGRALIDNVYKDHIAWDLGTLNPALPFDASVANVITLEGDFCAPATFWGYNYWHYTFQTLAQIQVMEEAGFTGTYLLVHAEFAEELLDLYGLDASRIMWLNELDSNSFYRFERMHLIARTRYDYEQAAKPLVKAAQRVLDTVNSRASTADERAYPTRLYVKRVGSRKLQGVDEVLEKYGFVTMVPEDHSIAEQVRFFNNARVVVTPHGANSTNSLYMRPESVFIEAFSKKWALPASVYPLREKGVHYLPVVQTPIVYDVTASVHDDFEVEPIVLEMVIKAALALAGETENQKESS